MRKKNKTELLNDLLKQLNPQDDGFNRIEYRGKSGWYGCFDDPRYIGDNGELLGFDYSQAVKSLHFFYGER